VLQVGDKAPDFKLPTTGGQELTLGDALQKYRALIFLGYVITGATRAGWYVLEKQ